MSTRRCVLILVLLGLVCSARRAVAKDAPPPPAGERRLVVLLLGGGVRAQDVTDATRMPAVRALGEEGMVVDAIASLRANTYLAARDLLTGRGDEPDEGGRPSPASPTLFEYLRSASGVPAESVWFVDAQGGDDLRLAASTHPSYGAALGARTCFGDGAFGEPLKGFLESVGRPLPVPDTVWPLLRRLRQVNRAAVGPYLPEGVDSGTLAAERVERAVLQELDRKATLVKAPSPDDERALRAALTVLAVHRPRLLVVRLLGAEVAQQSIETYLAVLAHADRGLGRLRTAVAADPQLAASTSFVVVTETGRNEQPGLSGELLADDASPSRRMAVLVAAGPGWRKGLRVKGARTLADVTPTLGRLLGVPTPLATGRVWEECFPR